VDKKLSGGKKLKVYGDKSGSNIPGANKSMTKSTGKKSGK
jgi:hypothetical protein